LETNPKPRGRKSFCPRKYRAKLRGFVEEGFLKEKLEKGFPIKPWKPQGRFLNQGFPKRF